MKSLEMLILLFHLTPATFKKAKIVYLIVYLLTIISALCLIGCDSIYSDRTSIIIDIFPAEHGDIVSADSTIIITFGIPVDPFQCESIFSISHNNSLVSGTINWIHENEKTKMEFTPKEHFTTGEQYTLSFQGIIQDHKGRMYNTDKNIVFYAAAKRADNPHIVYIQPKEGIITEPTDKIIIHFSMPMNKESAGEGFRIYPEIPIIKKWQDETTLIITPDKKWSKYSTYTIFFSVDTSSTCNRQLQNPFYSSFFFQPEIEFPTIVSIDIRENNPHHNFPTITTEPDNVHPDVCFSIHFSKTMNHESVQRSIFIEPDADIRFIWIDDSTVIIIPVTPFQKQKEHKLIVTGNGLCREGFNLAEKHIWPFQPRLEHQKIISIHGWPQDGFPVYYPFDIHVPITPLGPDNEYSFTINFQYPHVTDQQKIQTQDSISLSRIFPPDIPTPSLISNVWLDHKTLMLTFANFGERTFGRTGIYALQFPSGNRGVIGNNVLALEKNIVLYVEVE